MSEKIKMERLENRLSKHLKEAADDLIKKDMEEGHDVKAFFIVSTYEDFLGSNALDTLIVQENFIDKELLCEILENILQTMKMHLSTSESQPS